MIVALAALLFQISPAQPLDNPVTHADKPAVVVSATGNSAEAGAVSPWPMELALPLTDLRLRSGLSVLLSTPESAEDLAAALPSHPEAAIVGTLNGGNPAFIAAAPNPVRRAPTAAGLVSVLNLQAEVRRQKRVWFALSAVEHGAAAFDAWTTRRAIANGGQELNPLMKPFANSGAIYAATQAGPLLFDYVGKRMMMSRNPKLRRIWWLPQAASTAASLFSGVHNLRVH